MADSFAQFLKDTKDAPENRIKDFKKNIMSAIQASAQALSDSVAPAALSKAKEAETELKNLQDFMTSKAIEDPEFTSYKHIVILQLADAYKQNSMWEDALSRYHRLEKDREFAALHIVYLEIGNISSKTEKYEEAIKYYEMGINHLKPDSPRLLARFHQCCGVARIQMGDYHKALSAFETAMKHEPSVKTAFNLVLCHSVLSSHDDLKDAYVRLLSVRPVSVESTDTDTLGRQLQGERNEQLRFVMLASRVVAQKNEQDWQPSHEFVLQQLKASKYPEAAGGFEIAYALAFLNHRGASKAIEMLRQIRKKDPSVMALAATNLSFLYFLEQDFQNAAEYAAIALDNDKYNAQALVNQGNCFMQAGREDDARDQYLEAIGVAADCVEALYNFGLVSKRMGSYEEALQVLDKLSHIIPKCPEVAFEIADCYDKMGLTPQAIECLHRLLNLLPTDPAIWRKLGGIWDRDGNETQAFHCYSESYKFSPSDIEVVAWLGGYYRRHQYFDQALRYFERASAIAPKEPRYAMLVASCYKSMDSKQEALDVYERVLQMDSSNKQCLEQLVKLTTEMGLTAKADHYQKMHAEVVERLQQIEQEEMAQRAENRGATLGAGLGGTGFGMTQQNPPAATALPVREAIQVPALTVGKTDGLVQKTVAGGGGEDIWAGVDIELEGVG
jgi:intraflagellar transport protein 88